MIEYRLFKEQSKWSKKECELNKFIEKIFKEKDNFVKSFEDVLKITNEIGLQQKRSLLAVPAPHSNSNNNTEELEHEK